MFPDQSKVNHRLIARKTRLIKSAIASARQSPGRAAHPRTSRRRAFRKRRPFRLGVLRALLTDNGRVFFGRVERHPYELMLALHDIEPRTTKAHNPRTNGFVERMNCPCSTNASASRADRSGTRHPRRFNGTLTSILRGHFCYSNCIYRLFGSLVCVFNIINGHQD